MTTLLFRLAQYDGLDTKNFSTAALSKFTDAKKISKWAVDGVAWCVEKGILQGKGGNVLDPTTNVTRAEVAVMLDRFIALMK